MKPLLAAASGALVIALGATACGSASPNAATIGTTSIKRSDFEAELRAYANNAKFMATGQAGQASPGSVSNDFARSTLQTDILFELVHQEVAKRGLTVLPNTDPTVRSQTIGRFDQTGSPDIFNAFSKSFQDHSLTQTANLLTLQNALGGGPVDDPKLKAAYDADPRRFALLCASHILLKTEDDAKAVLADLQAGTDFGKEAAAKSTDTTAQQNNGQLRNQDGSCPNASAFDDDFVTGALAATPGTPSQPVKSQFGWHVILVQSVTPQPFDAVKDAVQSKLQNDIANKAGPQINDILTNGLKQHITVDPRYGIWDPNNHQILAPGTKVTPSHPTTSAPPGASTTAPAGGSTTAPAGATTTG